MTPPFAALLRDGPPWRTWGAAATAEAMARGVPLAVLVGDGLDAWTASWMNALRGDRDLAALLDGAFVPVAAERSDHPGLAALAQQVLALTADAAGVPCLLVMLPGSPPRPLGAVPYGPLRDASGRKGLARVLVETAEAWRQAPADLEAAGADLARTLAGLAFALAGGAFSPERAVDLAEAQIMAEVDPIAGGFGASPDGSAALPRWPQPEKLRLLAALAARPGAAPALAAHLDRTLAALAAGGIRDQLAGGFHRAAATADWREPLWEQRLADQARIARAFLDARALRGQGLHRTIAEQALLWAVEELAAAPGRYAAGWHALADSASGPGPGAFQRWSRGQCAELVGEEGARILAQRFGLGDEPGPLAIAAALDPADARRLPALVARLAAARRERRPPARDPRDDPAAHGLLLGALHAAAALPDPLPELVAARDAVCARLAGAVPEGRVQARAAVALGLAEAGEAAAAGRWLDGLGDGDQPVDDDPLVAPMPRDAEDTVDGPGAAGVLALARAALGDRAGCQAVARAHAGLLMRAPAAAPALVLAVLRCGG